MRKPSQLRWPRGRYNGQPIQGVKVSFEIHTLQWYWRPRASRNFGEPYFLWLCFSWRAATSYAYSDR